MWYGRKQTCQYLESSTSLNARLSPIYLASDTLYSVYLSYTFLDFKIYQVNKKP